MKRFTDPLLFAVLTIVAVLAWLIMEWQDAIPPVPEGMMTPMTVAVAVVISVPALIFVTVMALIRAIFNINPKSFWGIMFGGTLLASGTVALAAIITRAQGLELGFSTAAWLFAIAALASLVAVVLALTGAIPGPAKETSGSKSGEAQAVGSGSQQEEKDGKKRLGHRKHEETTVEAELSVDDAPESAIETELVGEVSPDGDLSYLEATEAVESLPDQDFQVAEVSEPTASEDSR